MNCYRCDIELSEDNSSEEHVIINACGGRLKSRKLLCAKCNSTFGDSFDKELAKRTNDLSNLLLINRHRGNPQPIKGKASKTGEDYFFEFGGIPKKVKPEISENKNGDRVELSISVDNEKQFKKILEGFKRKYPQIDVDEVIQKAQRGRRYLDDTITFNAQIGGKEVFKAITKTAINYYILCGGDSLFIKHLLPYLEGRAELDVVWMHYPQKLPYQFSEGEVSHVINLVADSKERIVYCYIELFNVHNYIIKLSEEYDGIDISSQYVYDILQLKTLEEKNICKYNRNDLLELFSNKDAKPFDMVKERFLRVLSIADSRQISKHQLELISSAIENSLGNGNEGEIISHEMINQTVKGIMKEMTPYILHLLRMNGKDK